MLMRDSSTSLRYAQNDKFECSGPQVVLIGFVKSKGHLGIFTVDENPFTISALPRVSYPPYDINAQITDELDQPDQDDENPSQEVPSQDDPSIVDHIMSGIEQQAQRELKKLGRDLTVCIRSHFSNFW
jgi:hypothetical protein